MRFAAIYHEKKHIIFLGVLLVIIAVIVVGCVVLPTVFYDQWIWKYYWGPVVADATPDTTTAVHNGVIAREGYTVVSEITYGVILIVALYALYKLLMKLKIAIDWYFCLALMPYILFGPVTRVLEDAVYFHEPFVYWFISPFIYIQIAVYALFFLLLGYYIEKKSKKQYLTVNTILFSGGLIFLIPSLLILLVQGSKSNVSHFDVFLLVIGLVSLITLLVYLFAYRYRSNENLVVYKNPLNLAMIAGHMIDGLTSYISIYDPLDMGLPLYLEKHPASNVLMEVWPPLFPLVKFVLIVVVIYLFDVLYKKELKSHVNLVNLLKIGILILGVSPGLRDLLRVTMGV